MALVAVLTASTCLSACSSGGGSSENSGQENVTIYRGSAPRHLVSLGPSLFVSSASAWRSLPSTTRHAAKVALKRRTLQLVDAARAGNLKVAKPRLGFHVSSHHASTAYNSSSLGASNHQDITLTSNSASAPAGTLQLPPFDGDQEDDGTALLDGESIGTLADATPCITVSSASTGQPLVACAGEIAPFDSGAPVDGTSETGLLAASPGGVAYGSTTEALTGNFYGLSGVSDATKQYISAQFNLITISFFFGWAVGGSCGRSDAVSTTFGSLGSTPPAPLPPQQDTQLTSCLGTFSTQLPTSQTQIVNDLIGVGQGAVSAIQSLTSSGNASTTLADQCSNLNKDLGLGSYANSLLTLTKDASDLDKSPSSLLPSPNVTADCQSTPISWTSPTPISGGTTLQFQIGDEVDARVIGGIALSLDFDSATGCVVMGSNRADLSAASCQNQTPILLSPPSTSTASTTTTLPPSTTTTTAPPTTNETSFDVSPNQQWNDTGIMLTAGEHVQITATGTVEYDVNQISRGDWSSTPAGYPVNSVIPPPGLNLSCPPTNSIYDGDETLVSAPCGSLVAEIGNGGTPFEVGVNDSFTADTSGDLMLGDNVWYWGSEAGGFTANITVGNF